MAVPGGEGQRGAEGAVMHLWSFREHPELALSALLRAVMGCFRSRDVGSTSRREIDAI